MTTHAPTNVLTIVQPTRPGARGFVYDPRDGTSTPFLPARPEIGTVVRVVSPVRNKGGLVDALPAGPGTVWQVIDSPWHYRRVGAWDNISYVPTNPNHLGLKMFKDSIRVTALDADGAEINRTFDVDIWIDTTMATA